MLKFRGTTLTERDVERMEDAAFDFLTLWLASLSIEERLASLKKADLDRRLEPREGLAGPRPPAGGPARRERDAGDPPLLLGRRPLARLPA